MHRFWRSLSVKLHLALGRLIMKFHIDWKPPLRSGKVRYSGRGYPCRCLCYNRGGEGEPEP